MLTLTTVFLFLMLYLGRKLLTLLSRRCRLVHHKGLGLLLVLDWHLVRWVELVLLTTYIGNVEILLLVVLRLKSPLVVLAAIVVLLIRLRAPIVRVTALLIGVP